MNLILATKSVMLIEDGQDTCAWFPSRRCPQMPLKLIRETENVGDVRPGELVTVVLDLESWMQASRSPSAPCFRQPVPWRRSRAGAG